MKRGGPASACKCKVVCSSAVGVCTVVRWCQMWRLRSRETRPVSGARARLRLRWLRVLLLKYYWYTRTRFKVRLYHTVRHTYSIRKPRSTYIIPPLWRFPCNTVSQPFPWFEPADSLVGLRERSSLSDGAPHPRPHPPSPAPSAHPDPNHKQATTSTNSS